MQILILEIDELDHSVRQELFDLLFERTGIQVKELFPGTENADTLEPQILDFPGLKIHIREEAVYKNGVLIPMSHYEFLTLCYLAKHPGWVFSRQQIYEAVWQEPEGDCDAAVTNVISQIRKKLNPNDPTHGYIRTVVNSGYKFVD